MDAKPSGQHSQDKNNQPQPAHHALPTAAAPDEGTHTLGNLAAANSPSSSSTPITTPAELIQRFALVFAPVLDECRGYNINSGPAGIPQALRDFVADPDNRELAWTALLYVGIPKNLSASQGHALMMSLLPHLVHGDASEMVQTSILIVAQQAADGRDYDLYRAIGEACSAAPITPKIMDFFAVPFCELSCHNLQQDKALKIWSDIFIERASQKSLGVMAGVILKRVGSGEKSSYDHLLTTLCKARDPVGISLLEFLMNPVQEKYQAVSTPQVTRRKITPKDLVKDAVAIVSIGVAAAVADVLLSPSVGHIVALAGGALWAVYAVSRRKVQQPPKPVSRELDEVRQSPSFAHLIERIYEKLVALAPLNPHASALKESIDTNPRYAHLKDAS
jgi:hypothetical protein